MYLNYFSFNEKPFSIAPDPRYLYMSQQHEEALAHLLYGLQGEGGIVLLTGEVGTGKTTMVRKLLEELPETVALAWIINPKLSALELLESICDELGIAHQYVSSIKAFTDCINKHLLDAHAQGKHTVLMIDEAQNLVPEVLEQLRLLTNLETNERKLLQIVLIGQPELQDMLNRYDLRQFSQRITARFHLNPLTQYETIYYIQHRLHIAGCEKNIFPKRVSKKIYQLSNGVPRLINLICDRSLLGAYAGNTLHVQMRHVKQAYREVLGQPHKQSVRWVPTMIYSSLLAILIASQVFLWNPSTESEVLLAENHHKTRMLAISPIATVKPIMPEPIMPEANVKSVVPITTASSPSSSPTSAQAAVAITTQASDSWQQMAAIGTQSYALQTLAILWKLNLDHEIHCSALAKNQHPCFRQRAKLARLRDFNRPAMIRLHQSPKKNDYYAVLSQLNGGIATLQLGQQSWDVSTEELQAHWYADFTLLWRAPPEFHRAIKLGNQGESVRWLASVLDDIQGKMIPAQSFSTMNAIMVERLKDFQQQAGLTPDGVAGPLTLIRMNDAAYIPRPHLFDVEAIKN
ncbi:MAG: AAA family ATPase [Mariprofundaceae bacterium]|nr:AAA family ATPase [Mariprofundaceae bacterium]